MKVSAQCLLQTVHVIRHGESEFNAATKYQPGFEDPQIFDPALTAKGRAQVLDITRLITGIHAYE